MKLHVLWAVSFLIMLSLMRDHKCQRTNPFSPTFWETIFQLYWLPEKHKGQWAYDRTV